MYTYMYCIENDRRFIAIESFLKATLYTVSRKKPNLENKSDTTDKWTDRHVDKSVLLVQEAASMGDRIPFSRHSNVLIFKDLISQNSP
jgi:hypothetical protein